MRSPRLFSTPPVILATTSSMLPASALPSSTPSNQNLLPSTLYLIAILFPLSGYSPTNKGRRVLGWIVAGMVGYVDAFEEAGLLQEFIGVLDYVDSTLAVAGRYGPPSIIVRTLVHEGLSRLDDFVREYRGYVGKVMDYVCGELRGLLYEVLGGE
jgi:hypothetical protein